ncbi:MAG: hypothetical protein HKN39_07440 [Flavobacteriales bacterium]|nr:hypothetical protein [Flavobacteriales bacterium]
MNALIEFIMIAGGSFLLFMFLGYRDAIRKTSPKGPLASILNKVKGWEFADDRGPRGILFRQPIWIKILLALLAALVIRGVYDLIFDFKWASGTFDIFTGPMAWLLHSGAIFLAMIMSYMWPKVKNKIVDLKDDALKKGDKVISESEKGFEELREKTKGSGPSKEAPKEKPDPETKAKEKDDPNDIINDYLN